MDDDDGTRNASDGSGADDGGSKRGDGENEKPAPQRAPRTWTWVRQASGDDPVARRLALGVLIKRHQDALYFKLRRHPECAAFAQQAGCSPGEIAYDAMQRLFELLIDGKKLGKLDPSRGSFLGWLKVCSLNQLRKDWHKYERAIGKRLEELDDLQQSERRYLEESDDLSAEQLCQRTFSLDLYRDAFKELQGKENGERFELLKRYLFEPTPQRVEDYAPIAKQLGVMPRTVASAVSRLRAKLRAIVHRLVIETLPDEDAYDERALSAHLRDHAKILRDTPYSAFADYVVESSGHAKGAEDDDDGPADRDGNESDGGDDHDDQ